MRVAAVGGSGFVGRHVMRRLNEQGFEAVNVDLRPPGEAQGGRFVEADLTAADGPESAARACGALDAVVWLAASITQTTGVDDSARSDISLMVDAPLRFLRALPSPPEAVSLFSSVEVYGRPRVLPVDEAHPTDPFTAYGVAKLCAEHYMGIWCRKHSVSLACLRVAFIYGPGQHPKNVIPRFIEAARGGQAPTIFGTGEDVRDDVYVDDVAQAAVLAIVKRADGVFNISSGRAHTLRDVAETVCAVAGPGLAPAYKAVESRWVDRWYSFDRARQVLGCPEPKPFAEGIAAMCNEVSS